MKKRLNLNRKTLYIIVSIILISIFSLTIVYAALSVTLSITGNTEVVAANWDIHLDNINVDKGSVNGDKPTITSTTTASFTTTLNNPGDYYMFTIDVVNDGTIDAMIDSVIKNPKLSQTQAKYINYIIEYENNEQVSTKQLIKSKSFVRLRVKVEFRKDISGSDLPSTPETLNLSFIVNYIQSDDSGKNVINNGKFVNVVNGDYDTVGSEICIKDECFYVISSTNDTVTMLSKYNIYVGGKNENNTWTAYGDEATGRQESTMLGRVLSEQTYNGTTAFSNTAQKGQNYCDYSGSIVERYVNDYNLYISTLEVKPLETRLITYEELENLGCKSSNTTCSDAPEWVYSTSYWTGTGRSSTHIWRIYSDKEFNFSGFYDRTLGVRPVITISKSEF